MFIQIIFDNFESNQRYVQKSVKVATTQQILPVAFDDNIIFNFHDGRVKSGRQFGNGGNAKLDQARSWAVASLHPFSLRIFRTECRQCDWPPWPPCNIPAAPVSLRSSTSIWKNWEWSDRRRPRRSHNSSPFSLRWSYSMATHDFKFFPSILKRLQIFDYSVHHKKFYFFQLIFFIIIILCAIRNLL